MSVAPEANRSKDGSGDARANEAAGHAKVAEQLAWFDGPAPVETPIYDRRFLAGDAVIAGPAIIDEY